MTGFKVHPHSLGDFAQSWSPGPAVPGGDEEYGAASEQNAVREAPQLTTVLRSYRSLKGMKLLFLAVAFPLWCFVTLDLSFPESTLAPTFVTQLVSDPATV